MIFWKLLITSSAFFWTATAKIQGGQMAHQEGEELADDRKLSTTFTTSSISSSDVVDVTPQRERWEPDLVAYFNDPYNLVGTVAVQQVEETQGTWVVRIDKIVVDPTLCPGFTGRLNWHVHAHPANEYDQDNCGGGVTGGHYDPTYACGPATDVPATVCTDLLATRPGYDYGAVCGINNPSGCELGDLSGKSGQVDTTALGQFQRFEDYWLGSVDDIEGLSIVFHCCTSGNGCGTRIACANLKPRRY